jgi:hypothetical protein
VALEPRIPHPPVRVVQGARELRAAIDPAGLGRWLEELPGPRDRIEHPEAAAATEEILLDRLGLEGWEVERRPFDLRGTRRTYGLFSQAVPDLAGVNIVATRRGSDPAGGVIVIGAHHDTLPTTPGADDNGAGLVALMAVARLLRGIPTRDTVVLAAFDHEEAGFHGAHAFVAALDRRQPFRGAVIYETMAYTAYGEGSQAVPPGLGLLFPGQVRRIRERGSIGDWNAIIYRRGAERLALRFAGVLEALAGEDTAVLLRDPADLPLIGPLLPAVPAVRNFARSDHIPFWSAGLPALQITDTANFRNPHYHQPTDTPDTVDLDRLADIVAATVVTVSPPPPEGYPSR